ncbi:MAG: hypothetical protein U1F57_10425 [bacterium]
MGKPEATCNAIKASNCDDYMAEMERLIAETPENADNAYPSKQLVVSNKFIANHPEFEQERTNVYVLYLDAFAQLKKEGKATEPQAPAPQSILTRTPPKAEAKQKEIAPLLKRLPDVKIPDGEMILRMNKILQKRMEHFEKIQKLIPKEKQEESVTEPTPPSKAEEALDKAQESLGSSFLEAQKAIDEMQLNPLWIAALQFALARTDE